MRTVDTLKYLDRLILHRGGWEYEAHFICADRAGYMVQVRADTFRGDRYFFWDDVTAWIGDPSTGAQVVHHVDEVLPVTVPELE